MNPPPRHPSDLRGLVFLCLGTLAICLFLQAVLEDARLSSACLSRPTWASLIESLGAQHDPAAPESVRVPLLPMLGPAVVLFSALAWLAGGALETRRRRKSLTEGLLDWAARGWMWWLLPGLWWILWTAGLLAASETAVALLLETAELWFAVSLAGWICAWFAADESPAAVHVANVPDLTADAGKRRASRRAWLVLAAAVAAYTITLTAMNWGLWFNLRVPHGDSAMYEEHLWNLEHGKGFRSYLDQGLFLGEHIQVIHLFLLPLHLLWPSHLLLELCESLVLALGAVPVFRMALRFGGSQRAALLLAAAYLLYSPLQSLDITIDLKTFRPNAFGVPLLLFALDALERRRYRALIVWLLLTLTAQEDYAIVIGLIGGWLMLSPESEVAVPSGRWAIVRRLTARPHRPRLYLGAALVLFGIAYLLLTFKVVLPYFREGATIHYASYFARFGKTPGEIAWTMLTQPRRVAAEVVTVAGIVYALRLLVPLGGLPVRSPGRLLVAAPLFVLLCLNELALQPPAPVHHFHAPLVPVLLWAAAAGLATSYTWSRKPQPIGASRKSQAVRRARFACACALCTGLFAGISPLSTTFWDPGSSRYWRSLYLPSERARRFPQVEALIPDEARVASTDFVHARLTHRARSYDYSDYLRKVAGYENRVPDDADYIVIDIEHPYHTPERVLELRRDPHAAVRELREHPDQWELLPDPTDGYFLILQRRP